MMKTKGWSNQISVIVMIGITCLTQVLTIAKTSLVAGTFGASAEMDAYNFANNIVSFLFGFVASGITTVIIPQYVSKERKNVDTFITLIYGVLIVSVGMLILLRYQIVGIMSNKDEIYINIACNSMIILLVSNMLVSVSDITAAYFQCIDRYNIPKIVNFFAQFLVVIVLVFARDIDIIQYAYIIAFGVVLNFTFDLIIAIKCGWRYKPRFSFGSEGAKKLIIQFLPILVSSGIYRVSLLVDALIAACLDTGKLTILSYSNQISGMVNTVFIGTLLVYYYPKLVKKINNNDNNQEYFWQQSALFHALIGLLIVGFIGVGQEGVALLFQHGKFDQNATMGVFYGTLIYIVGQQTNVIRDLIYRYFYAKGDTKTAARNSIIVTIVNVITSIILVLTIGFYGIILGTVFASLVSLIIIFIKFKNKFGLYKKAGKLVMSYVRNCIAMIITIGIVIASKQLLFIDSSIIKILVFGTETTIIYLIALFFINRVVYDAFKTI